MCDLQSNQEADHEGYPSKAKDETGRGTHEQSFVVSPDAALTSFATLEECNECVTANQASKDHDHWHQ